LFTKLDDIDDDLFLNGDIYGEKKLFEIYGIRTRKNELIKIELKTGVPYLAVLNLYFRYETKILKFKSV
jgi:hypothetical protein